MIRSGCEAVQTGHRAECSPKPGNVIRPPGGLGGPSGLMSGRAKRHDREAAPSSPALLTFGGRPLRRGFGASCRIVHVPSGCSTTVIRNGSSQAVSVLSQRRPGRSCRPPPLASRAPAEPLRDRRGVPALRASRVPWFASHGQGNPSTPTQRSGLSEPVNPFPASWLQITDESRPCPVLQPNRSPCPLGTSMPRCRKAACVSIRPRGVRWMRPC